MQSNEKPTDLINSFLTQADLCTKEISTRFKLNSIINEFDDIVNKDFNRIVSLSNIRYQDVKCGKPIRSVLKEQRKDFNNLSLNVTSNDFYNNNDIKKEKDKIGKLINDSVKVKEMELLRNKIKLSIHHNHALLQHKPDSRTTTNSFISNKFNQRTKSSSSNNNTPTNANASIQSFTNKQPEIEQECIKISKETVLNNQRMFLINLLKDDEQTIEMQLKEYKDNLKAIKLQEDGNNVIKLNKKTKGDNMQKAFSFDKINLLNYKKIEAIKEDSSMNKNKIIENNNDNNKSIDLKKVIKYTRRGQQAKCLSNKNMINSNLKHKKSQSHKLININPSFPNDKCNTMKLIKAQVNYCECIDERFDKKRHRLNKFLNDDIVQIPWMTVRNRKHSNSLSLFKQSHFSTKNTKATKVNLRKVNSGELKMIDKFQQIYEQKKKEWELEENNNIKLNSAQAIEQKKTDKFLHDLALIPRRPQLFVDGYSSKKNKNEELKGFAYALGNKTFYTKKKLNIELNNFFMKKELYFNEINKKLNEEKEKRKLLEEIAKDKKKKNHDAFVKKLIIQKNQIENEAKSEFGNILHEGKKIKNNSYRNIENEYNNYLQYKQEFIGKISKQQKNSDQSKESIDANIMITSQRNKLNTNSNSVRVYNLNNKSHHKLRNRAFSLKIISNQLNHDI